MFRIPLTVPPLGHRSPFYRRHKSTDGHAAPARIGKLHTSKKHIFLTMFSFKVEHAVNQSLKFLITKLKNLVVLAPGFQLSCSSIIN